MADRRAYAGPVEALTMEEAAAFVGLGPRQFRKSAPPSVRIGDQERWTRETLENLRWNADPEKSLYFIGTNDGDFIKIGIAKNVRQRCADMQVANPFELVPILTLPGSRRLEARFHAALRADHVRGEWFRIGPWFDEVTAWGSSPDRDSVFSWLKARGA